MQINQQTVSSLYQFKDLLDFDNVNFKLSQSYVLVISKDCQFQTVFFD